MHTHTPTTTNNPYIYIDTHRQTYATEEMQPAISEMQPRFVISVLFVLKRCNHRDATTVCNFIKIVLTEMQPLTLFAKSPIRQVITVIPKPSAQSSIRPELIVPRIWMCLLGSMRPELIKPRGFLLLLTTIFRVDHYHCVSVSGVATVSVWFDKTKCIVSLSFVTRPHRPKHPPSTLSMVAAEHTRASPPASGLEGQTRERRDKHGHGEWGKG